MNKIFRTPISELKEFKRETVFTHKFVANDGLWYLYEVWENVFGEDERRGYEIVRAVKQKQPDGSDVYCYPSSEQFGVNGWYICGTKPNMLRSLEKIKAKRPDLNIEYFADFILDKCKRGETFYGFSISQQEQYNLLH